MACTQRFLCLILGSTAVVVVDAVAVVEAVQPFVVVVVVVVIVVIVVGVVDMEAVFFMVDEGGGIMEEEEDGLGFPWISWRINSKFWKSPSIRSWSALSRNLLSSRIPFLADDDDDDDDEVVGVAAIVFVFIAIVEPAVLVVAAEEERNGRCCSEGDAGGEGSGVMAAMPSRFLDFFLVVDSTMCGGGMGRLLVYEGGREVTTSERERGREVERECTRAVCICSSSSQKQEKKKLENGDRMTAGPVRAMESEATRQGDDHPQGTITVALGETYSKAARERVPDLLSRLSVHGHGALAADHRCSIQTAGWVVVVLPARAFVEGRNFKNILSLRVFTEYHT